MNAIFLGIAAVVLLAAVLLRRPRRLFWGALAAAAVLLVTLTAVFDNVMIASGIMAYTEHNISGVQVGLAPLEDFAYPVAGVLLLPALWLLLGSRVQEEADEAGDPAEGALPGAGLPASGLPNGRTPDARTSEGRRPTNETGGRSC
ncbi:hypothetical protein KVA01_22890 [Kocuria varians]|uniref:Lycopene cyclase domain-containing protein n=1 Tax=Kocuria varians TaxID=1272 RepID=A0A4Y4D8S2_KOCVA|nr:hypothetical protein KVA01_22890 [Kocuria varians]